MLKKFTSSIFLVIAMMVCKSVAHAQLDASAADASSVLSIFNVEIKDETKWREYIPLAGATIGAFGGELVIRGVVTKTLSGQPIPHKLGRVIRFPSLEAVETWYASDAYTPLITLRDEAAVVTQTIYQTIN